MLLIVFISCEKDLYDVTPHQHLESKFKGNIKITEKSFNELLLDKKFKKAYEKVSNTTAKNAFSKTIMEAKSNFTILNLPAKVIQKGNKISYTFQIARDTINVKYFENLIVGVDSLNQTKAYIAKYEINNDVIQLKNKIPFKSVTYHPIIFNKSSTAKITECISITYSLCNGVPYDCGGSICGFGELTVCSGSGGESNNGSGTTWGGSVGSGSTTTTTPLYSGGSSGTITYTNAEKFFLGFSPISNERTLLTAMSLEASNLLSSYLNSNPYPSTNSTAAKTFVSNLSNYSDWFSSQTVENQIGIFNYLIPNNFSSDSRNFVSQIINVSVNGVNADFNNFFYNRTSLDANSAIDIDNNSIGGYDNTVYNNFDPQQSPWPNIPSIIPASQFIGFGAEGIRRNCMDYAKAQIAKMGYKISNYYDTGQTFKIYNEQTGVNRTELAKGLSYLKYALSKGIPVIVGIDDALGVPLNSNGTPGNPDLTTDHFIVIVGMGTNSQGNYFQFYDNASGYASQGANSSNLLYYNPTTGIISGKSQTSYAQSSGLHNYIITQIRKSKLL